jgi:hypothetical protein
VENHEPQWDELEDLEVMDFKKFPLAMKSCISHYKLDLKQAAAFNVICSTFMLARLEEHSLKKIESYRDRQSQTSIIGQGGTGETSHEFDRTLW